MTLGAGITALGASRVGYGTPSQSNSSVARMYIKADGTQGNCAKIDPLTGDYVLDDDGNSVGDESINQMVYLALFTLKGTSAVSGFGLDIDVNNTVINTSTATKIKLAVYAALKHLTDPKLITIASVKADRASPTGMQILIQWIDNSSGEFNELTL